MKKFGFTLAEVMVALALIGVITSLTIPTFVSSNKNRTHAAKAATTVSALENAFTSMISTEAVQDLSETSFGRDPNASNLSKYLKLSNSTNSMGTYYSSGNPFLQISPKESSNLFVSTGVQIYELKNGALVMFIKKEPSAIVPSDDPDAKEITLESLGGTVTGSIGLIAIDVNGSATPNIWGRDAFYFRVGNDGLLYPAGSLNFSILQEGDGKHLWNSPASSFVCLDGQKNMGCTARLLEKNYEVDY